MSPPNSDRMFGSLDFKNPLPIEITIFLEIAAPDKLTPMITSFIFCSKSSLTKLVLPCSLKIGGSKSFVWLSNLCFQLLTDVNKKLYCGCFHLTRLIAAYVLLLYAYFLTSSITREDILVLYEECLLPFFLPKLSSLAFTADASAAVTVPVALTNFEVPVWDLFLFFWLLKYERRSLVTMISLQHKITVFHSTHW